VNFKSTFVQINENLNMVIASAKAIGVQTINLGASELVNGDKHPHLVLGLVWQLGNRLHRLYCLSLNDVCSEITIAEHD
jgi:hypothetical protein